MAVKHPAEQGTGGHDALSDALSASFRILRYVLIIVLLGYLLSGIFVVGQHERAYVLAFGKLAEGPDRLKGPGFHITLPRPFSEVVKVSSERSRTVETMTFWTETLQTAGLPEGLQVRGNQRSGKFGYTLTADANVMHSRWAVRYQIEDPESYVFRFEDADSILLSELDHAVVKTSTRLNIDQALRTDVEAFRSGVEDELRRRISAIGLGVRIERIDLLDRAPPQQVAMAFDSVIRAENERSKRVSNANAQAARILNEAKGEASRLKAEALAERTITVNEVRSDAEYFTKIYARYQDSPTALIQTLGSDAVGRILENVEKKTILRTRGKRRFLIDSSSSKPLLETP